MTVPGPGATEEIGVNPAAPRPTIGFRLNVPDEMVPFDLDPATADTWLEHLLDQRSAGVPGAAAQRSRTRQVLQDVLAQHRSADVFFAAFLAGSGPRPGDVVGAGLTFAWRQFTGGIDLDGLETFFAEDEPGAGEDLTAREVRRVDLPAGESVLVRSKLQLPVPLTSRRQDVAIVQHLVPVPDSEWLAVLTMTTPDVAEADAFAEFAGRVAASLEFIDGGLPNGQRAEPEPEPSPDRPPQPPGRLSGTDHSGPNSAPRPGPTGTIGYLPPP